MSFQINARARNEKRKIMYLENVRKRFCERYFSDLSNTRHLHRRLAKVQLTVRNVKSAPKLYLLPGAKKNLAKKQETKNGRKHGKKCGIKKSDNLNHSLVYICFSNCLKVVFKLSVPYYFRPSKRVVLWWYCLSTKVVLPYLKPFLNPKYIC